MASTRAVKVLSCCVYIRDLVSLDSTTSVANSHAGRGLSIVPSVPNAVVVGMPNRRSEIVLYFLTNQMAR